MSVGLSLLLCVQSVYQYVYLTVGLSVFLSLCLHFTINVPVDENNLNGYNVLFDPVCVLSNARISSLSHHVRKHHSKISVIRLDGR